MKLLFELKTKFNKIFLQSYLICIIFFFFTNHNSWQIKVLNALNDLFTVRALLVLKLLIAKIANNDMFARINNYFTFLIFADKA